MVDVTAWNETPASNNTIAGGSIAENTTSPAHVNNALREIMAGVKTYTLTVSTTYAPLTSATLTTPTINGGTLNAASIVNDTGTIATNSVGFRGIPANAKTGAYTLLLTDCGKHISITTGGVAIPANGTTAFPIGTTIGVYNDSASTQSITITTDTLRLGGSASTGTRTLAIRGFATLVKVNTTEWIALGNVT
jgi:hypothetical protein